MCLDLLPTVHTPVWTFHVFGSTSHSSHSGGNSSHSSWTFMCLALLPTVHTPVWTFHVFGSTFHSSHSRLNLSCVWIYFPQFTLQAETFMCLALLSTVHTPAEPFMCLALLSTVHTPAEPFMCLALLSTVHTPAEPFMCLALLPTVHTPGWNFHVFGSTSHSSHSRLNLSCVWIYFPQFTLQLNLSCVWLYFLQFTLQADALSRMVKEAEARDQETEAASWKCSQGKGHWPWSGSAACCWPNQSAPCRRQPVGCGMSSLSCWSGVALCPSSWWHQTAPAIDFFMMLVIAKHNGIHQIWIWILFCSKILLIPFFQQ